MIAEAEQNVRELLDVPENYHVIYMQGGAHLQVCDQPQRPQPSTSVATSVC